MQISVASSKHIRAGKADCDVFAARTGLNRHLSLTKHPHLQDDSSNAARPAAARLTKPRPQASTSFRKSVTLENPPFSAPPAAIIDDDLPTPRPVSLPPAAHARWSHRASSNEHTDMSSDRLRQVVKRASMLFDKPPNGETQEIDITAAIAVLQELKKNATPAELAMLQRALLAADAGQIPESKPPAYHRKSSAGIPGRATRSTRPTLDALHGSRDPIEHLNDRPHSVSVPVAFAKGADKVAHKYFVQGGADALHRSFTPADLEKTSIGSCELGTLRVTNGRASPEQDNIECNVTNYEHIGDPSCDPDWVRSPKLPSGHHVQAGQLVSIAHQTYKSIASPGTINEGRHEDTSTDSNPDQRNHSSSDSDAACLHGLLTPDRSKCDSGYASDTSSFNAKHVPCLDQLSNHALVYPQAQAPLPPPAVPGFTPNITHDRTFSDYDAATAASSFALPADCDTTMEAGMHGQTGPAPTRSLKLKGQHRRSCKAPPPSYPEANDVSTSTTKLPADIRYDVPQIPDDLLANFSQRDSHRALSSDDKVADASNSSPGKGFRRRYVPIISTEAHPARWESPVMMSPPVIDERQEPVTRKGLFKFVGRSRSKSRGRPEVNLPRDTRTVAETIDQSPMASPNIASSSRVPRMASVDLHLGEIASERPIRLQLTSEEAQQLARKRSRDCMPSRSRSRPRQVNIDGESHSTLVRQRSKSLSPRTDQLLCDYFAQEAAPPVPKLPANDMNMWSGDAHMAPLRVKARARSKTLNAGSARRPTIIDATSATSPTIVVSRYVTPKSLDLSGPVKTKTSGPKLPLKEIGVNARERADSADNRHKTYNAYRSLQAVPVSQATPRTLTLGEGSSNMIGLGLGLDGLTSDVPFDRYGGGLAYGWERGKGFHGSAGTRQNSRERIHKSTELRGNFGVDLGDVPVFSSSAR